jgi:hypothetical protein
MTAGPRDKDSAILPMEVPMRASQKESPGDNDPRSFSGWDYAVLILVSVSLLVFSGLVAVQHIASSLDR